MPGYESLSYTYSFVDGIFDVQKDDLASYYTKWGRVLVVLDEVVNKHYGDAIKKCSSLPHLGRSILGAS